MAISGAAATRPYLLPTLAVVGMAAGLIAGDAHDMTYFAKTTDLQRFTETFNGTFTEAAEFQPLYLLWVGPAQQLC